MKKNIIFIFLFINCVLVGFVSCKDRELTKEEITTTAKKFHIPIYTLAEHVKFYNQGNTTYGVNYEAKVPYDSLEVLHFYDINMEKLGFKPFVEMYYKYSDRKWREFDDMRKKGHPYVAQLIADWVDAKHTKRARLVLNYYWYFKNANSQRIIYENDNLKVNFQIMPFSILPPPQ